MSDSVIPTITSIGGAFLTGIMAGFFVKKIIKILMFVAGGAAALLLYLQQQEIISVNMDKLEGSYAFILNLVVSSFEKISLIGDTTYLGIPVVGGFSTGFAAGFIKG